MSLSISFQNRNLHELHATHTRSFGVQAAALPSIEQLNLSHNHLRSLECPFAELRRDDQAQPSGSGFARHPPSPLPLRPDASSLSAVDGGAQLSSSAGSNATPSLEEERSGLRSLTSLRRLLVSHNALRSLLGLAGAAHTLTTLIATHNRLTSLDGLQACRHLRYIDVSHNVIESLRGLPLTPVRVAGREKAAPAAAAAALSVVHTDPALALSGIEDSTDDTSSVNFSCITPPGDGAHLHFVSDAFSAAAAAAGRPSASTNTSVQFHIDGTPAAHSLVDGATPASAAAAAATVNGTEVAEADLVLILSHNRLRSRALAALLWVDGEGDGATAAAVARSPQADVSESSVLQQQQQQQQRTSRTGAMLLRPWSTALTHLDLAHNYIEDIRSVRRLLSTVPWPLDDTARRSIHGSTTPAASGSSSVVCGPVLPRLRHLDVSGNPFLVNGALARDMATAAVAAAASVSWEEDKAASLETSPAQSARLATATTTAPAVTLHVRYESPALREALRSSALLSSGQSALPDPSSAKSAMAAALRQLGEDWRSTALLHSALTNSFGGGSASSSTTPFALFTAAERQASAAVAAASSSTGAEVSVLLYGGEVTVFAAALQQRGARLAEVLSVPAGEVHAENARARATSTRQARTLAKHADTLDVFMTPPPRWGSGASVSATFIQTSLLSDVSPPSPSQSPPRLPPQQHRQQQQQRHTRRDTASLSPISTAPPSAARRGEAEGRAEGSDITTASVAETSTLGYRLYQGRGVGGGSTAARRSASPNDRGAAAPVQTRGASESPPRASSAVVAASAVAPLVVSPSRPSSTANTDDAVALQLYKAEVSVLRARFRELQRHTRDQACVVQRHEAALRALKEQVVNALRERDAVQAELARAQDEIARLRAHVGDADAERASYAARD